MVGWDDFKPCYVVVDTETGEIIANKRPYSSIKMALANNRFKGDRWTLAEYRISRVFSNKELNNEQKEL